MPDKSLTLEDIAAFSTFEGLTMLPVSDIIYAKSNGNYTSIFQRDKTELIVSKKIKEVEAFLPKQYFIRIHKGYLVNKTYVRNYLKSESQLHLSNGILLPLASRRKSDVLNQFPTL